MSITLHCNAPNTITNAISKSIVYGLHYYVHNQYSHSVQKPWHVPRLWTIRWRPFKASWPHTDSTGSKCRRYWNRTAIKLRRKKLNISNIVIGKNIFSSLWLKIPEMFAKSILADFLASWIRSFGDYTSKFIQTIIADNQTPESRLFCSPFFFLGCLRPFWLPCAVALPCPALLLLE